MITINEIDTTRSSIELFTRFYQDLYVAQFPDPDERESLANMLAYLEKKAVGWYGMNNYHIAVATMDGQPVGGAVADYFCGPNAGVIEFLTVAATSRRQALGRRLHDAMIAQMTADARRAYGRPLDYSFAEMNDPRKTDPKTDNMDPVLRSKIWAGWGYRTVDIPYVQPALSPEQTPVVNLCLIAKVWQIPDQSSVPAVTVEGVLHDYLLWAMRIDPPADNAEYRAMVGYLHNRATIDLLQLATDLPEG